MGVGKPSAWESMLPLVADEGHSIVSSGYNEHVLGRGGEEVGGKEGGREEHGVSTELMILGDCGGRKMIFIEKSKMDISFEVLAELASIKGQGSRIST